jgi:hypothetical protein
MPATVSAQASVTALLLDANVLLDNAQGMAHTLSRNLRQSEAVDGTLGKRHSRHGTAH